MNPAKLFLASLSELQRTYWLSLREDTWRFLREDLPNLLEVYFPSGYVRLGEFVLSLRSGEYIEKASYSDEETEFAYVSVNNFSSETPDLDDIVFLDTVVGERFKAIALCDGDLIITRSGTVGRVHAFHPPDNKYYIPSHHLAVLKLPDEVSRAQFLRFYLQTDFARNFFWAHATGKSQKEITNWSIRRIPVPRMDNYAEVARNCREIECQIEELRNKSRDLQDIIEEVFVAYQLKPSGHPDRKEILQFSLSDISRQLYLRCGAQYRAFYENHKGLLFDDPEPKYRIRRLGELMHPYPATVLKKGVLDEEYILIELKNIESLTGRIITEDNVVAEIGSDKVVFGDCDLLVGKLRPYLGYAVLNDKDKPYIGTTELLPFSVNDDLTMPGYLRYLLLSRDFLHVSSMLMYGKEHPRIHPGDLLAIRVPCPPLEVQKSIVVDDIHEKEQKNQETRIKIEELRQEIDRILWESLLSQRQEPE